MLLLEDSEPLWSGSSLYISTSDFLERELFDEDGKYRNCGCTAENEKIG